MTLQERIEYRKQRVLEQGQLKHELEKEHGLIGHPKADELWHLAWEHGHSCGYREVELYYEEFAELLK